MDSACSMSWDDLSCTVFIEKPCSCDEFVYLFYGFRIGCWVLERLLEGYDVD